MAKSINITSIGESPAVAPVVQEYQLNFDEVENDQVSINNVFIWVNASDISFDITYSTTDLDIAIICDFGISNNPNTGRVSFGKTNNAGLLALQIWKPNEVFSDVTVYLPTQVLNSDTRIRMKNREFYFNEVLKFTIQEDVYNIDSNVINSILCKGQLNGVISSASINNENFPLLGSGNTITGDLGTVATITTSSIVPNYIDDVMWKDILPEQKLVFDGTKVVDFDYPDVFSALHTDFNFEIEFHSDDVLQNGVMASAGVLGSVVSAYCSLSMIDNGLCRLRLTNTSGGQIIKDFLINNGVNVVKNEGLNLYLNGELINMSVDLGLLNFDLSSNGLFLGRLSYSGSSFFFYQGTITNFTFLGERFLLNEGTGLITEGSQGTIGTLTNVDMWKLVVNYENKLVFDALEGDGLRINNSGTYTNLSDLNFEIKADIQDLNDGIIISLGSFNNPSTGLFRMLLQAGTNNLSVYISDVSNTNDQRFSSILSLGIHTFKKEGLLFYIDGVLVNAFTEQFINISDLFPCGVFNAGYFTGGYLNGILYNLSINDENFNFYEGGGLITRGDQGTFATLTREEMWVPITEGVSAGSVTITINGVPKTFRKGQFKLAYSHAPNWLILEEATAKKDKIRVNVLNDTIEINEITFVGDLNSLYLELVKVLY